MQETILWEDRKRIMGMPITFTKYKITQTKLICEEGMINTKRDILQIYRIVDISMTTSITQKLFKVGTIELHTNDNTHSVLLLENIQNPSEVMDMLNDQVENARKDRGISMTEIIGGRDII